MGMFGRVLCILVVGSVPCVVGFFKWYKLFQSEMDKVGLLFVTFLQENERIMV